MIVLLPSAKQMKCRQEIDSISLDPKTTEIVKYFSNLTADEISKIFKISLENSFKELNRFKNIYQNKAKKYRAIELFDGLMYRNIKRENLLNKEKEYIEKNVYICTSLHGIVNSYDAINIRDKFIKTIFIENGKIHSTISKKARGKFLTYLIENDVQKISDFEKISFDGFQFKRKEDNKYIYEK